jgi:hypothetical protein
LPNEFMSARSDDGVTWQREPGVRFAELRAADPDAVPLDGGAWRLYYTEGPSALNSGLDAGPAIASAWSPDGSTFVREPGVRVSACSASATVRLADGTFRMYCHTRRIFQTGSPSDDRRSYIVSFLSRDGLQFDLEPGVRVSSAAYGRLVGAEAPSISRDPEGGWLMAFTSVWEPTFPGNALVVLDNPTRRRFERQGTPAGALPLSERNRVRARPSGCRRADR